MGITFYATQGTQRSVTVGARTLPCRTTPGLSRVDHIVEALGAMSPFEVPLCHVEDAEFVARASAAFGPAIAGLRRHLERRWHELCKAMAPLDEWGISGMCDTVRSVAVIKKPGAMAAIIVLLRWPDVSIAREFIRGFVFVGAIESSGLFKQLHHDWGDGPTGLADLLGPEAESVASETHASLRPSSSDEFFNEKCLEDVVKGLPQGRLRMLKLWSSKAPVGTVRSGVSFTLIQAGKAGALMILPIRSKLRTDERKP